MAYRDDLRPWYVRAEVWFMAMALWLVLVFIAGINLVRTGDLLSAVLWYGLTGFGIVVFPATAWYMKATPEDHSPGRTDDEA